MRVRRSKRISGSGTRTVAGQVVSLERRCSALERDISMLTFEDRLRQLTRRVATLEEEKRTS